MKLKKIAITNYRQFQNAVINFDDELTILAGANNSGKTSIIELFKRIFKDKNFSKEDISAEYYSKLQYDFISCINKIYNITDKETEFRENVKKEFSTENNNKWTAIKIKIEVQYDKNESISLFSDYLMELIDEIKDDDGITNAGLIQYYKDYVTVMQTLRNYSREQKKFGLVGKTDID